MPEENDVALSERVRRVNVFSKDAILISIHWNAIGKVPEWIPAADGSYLLVAIMYNEYYG